MKSFNERIREATVNFENDDFYFECEYAEDKYDELEAYEFEELDEEMIKNFLKMDDMPEFKLKYEDGQIPTTEQLIQYSKQIEDYGKEVWYIYVWACKLYNFMSCDEKIWPDDIRSYFRKFYKKYKFSNRKEFWDKFNKLKKTIDESLKNLCDFLELFRSDEYVAFYDSQHYNEFCQAGDDAEEAANRLEDPLYYMDCALRLSERDEEYINCFLR